MAEEDLIFGKNRHFFGGIEPSNMKEFVVADDGTDITITATLPDDTIIDGQTLCSVAGAVIRRKSSGFPKDEFDGDLVLNIEDSASFKDTGAVSGNRYYYGAFPYTTQGVYNRNAENRSSVNADKMSINIDATVSSINLSFTIPSGYAGVTIRKSTTGYPLNETDGIEVGTFTSSTSYSDTAVEGGMSYFYSFFLYDAEGQYLYDERNRASATPAKVEYTYGYDLVTSTQNPSTRVSYPSDVDNYGFTPVSLNNGQFNSGGWDLTPGKYFMPKPCMLNYDGTVAYYLNPNNYKEKEDGSVSDVDKLSFNGNAMMEWPKIYTKRWEENGVYHFRCSNVAHDSDWDCWCNYDRNDNIIEHFYTPIYIGCVVSNRMRSISGQSPTSANNTAEQQIAYATANGEDWYLEVLADRLLIQDLLVLIGKSTDGQSVFGMGYRGYDTVSGTMDTNGLFYGTSGTSQGIAKVFGMEHFWGYVYRRTAGWITTQNNCYLKLTRGNHDGSTAADYNTTGDGYTHFPTMWSKSGGYINLMWTFSYGRIPYGFNGSSTTYECDYVFPAPAANVTAFACLGGYYSMSTAYAGPFYADVSMSSLTTSDLICASISCKPLAGA